jgi:hypothetical protein
MRKGRGQASVSTLPAWRSSDAPGREPEMVEPDGTVRAILSELESRALLRGAQHDLARPGALALLPSGQHGEVCGWLDRSPVGNGPLASQRIAMVEVLDAANPEADTLEQRLFPENEIQVIREWPSDTFLRRWAWRLQPKPTVQ